MKKKWKVIFTIRGEKWNCLSIFPEPSKTIAKPSSFSKKKNSSQYSQHWFCSKYLWQQEVSKLCVYNSIFSDDVLMFPKSFLIFLCKWMCQTMTASGEQRSRQGGGIVRPPKHLPAQMKTQNPVEFILDEEAKDRTALWVLSGHTKLPCCAHSQHPYLQSFTVSNVQWGTGVF